jgi:hypothetical protein
MGGNLSSPEDLLEHRPRDHVELLVVFAEDALFLRIRHLVLALSAERVFALTDFFVAGFGLLLFLFLFVSLTRFT